PTRFFYRSKKWHVHITSFQKGDLTATLEATISKRLAESHAFRARTTRRAAISNRPNLALRNGSPKILRSYPNGKARRAPTSPRSMLRWGARKMRFEKGDRCSNCGR